MSGKDTGGHCRARTPSYRKRALHHGADREKILAKQRKKTAYIIATRRCHLMGVLAARGVVIPEADIEQVTNVLKLDDPSGMK